MYKIKVTPQDLIEGVKLNKPKTKEEDTAKDESGKKLTGFLLKTPLQHKTERPLDATEKKLSDNIETLKKLADDKQKEYESLLREYKSTYTASSIAALPKDKQQHLERVFNEVTAAAKKAKEDHASASKELDNYRVGKWADYWVGKYPPKEEGKK